MKTQLLTVVLILLTTVFTTANAGYAGNVVQTDTPSVLLKQGIGKLTGFIKSGQAANRAQARAFLKTEIAPYFDFAYMTRWSAGPAWRRMGPEQRARMQEQLTESFLTTLAQRLTSFTNQPVRFFTPRGQGRNDVRVSAWIMQPSGYPTKLEFRFYRGRNGWKIFDVKADGNSAVVYYRKQFKDSLRYSRPAGRF
jgi:phospholipid transport system substrate-binding protein